MTRVARRLAGIGADDLSNSTEFDAYIGPPREVTVDHLRGILALHDGVTAGGKRFNAANDNGLNVKIFGAVGNDSTDNTAAFNAAIAAASTLGMSVFVPPGTYRVTSLGNIPPNVVIRGAGRALSKIRTTSATLDVISIDGANAGVHDLYIDASVVRSAGSFINITTNASTVDISHINMVGAFRGITIPSVALVHLSHIDILDTVATTGVSINVSGGFALIFDNIICRNDPAARPFAHLNITHVEDLMVSNSQFISAITDLNMAPGSGQAIGLFRSTNTQYDDADGPAIRIAPTGTGKVNEVVIDAPWIKGGAIQDVLITNAGGGTVDTVSVLNALMTGSGIGIDAHGVANIKLHNLAIGGHSTAISLVNVAGGIVQGNVIGPTGLYASNDTGISMTGTTDRVAVTGNQLTGNTTPLTNTSSGGNNVIDGNVGYPAALGGAAITVGPSPFTYTSGASPEVVAINGGAVSVIAISGAPILQTTGHAISLAPNQNLTVTYSATPAMVKFVGK